MAAGTGTGAGGIETKGPLRLASVWDGQRPRRRTTISSGPHPSVTLVHPREDGDHEETYAAGQRCRPGSLVPERLRNHGHRPPGRGGVRAAGRRRGAVSLRVGLVALAALRGGTPLHGRARPCNDPGSPLLPVLWAVPCVHPQRQRQAPRLV